jgi:hypothetical protein
MGARNNKLRLMKDKFYVIPTFENYSINKLGEVKSHKNGIEKELFGSINNKGYRNYRLTNSDGTKTLTLGRLLLMTFDRLPMNNEVCDHIDRNNKNDIIENLRWVSQGVNNSNKNSYSKKYTGVYYKKAILKDGTEKTYYQTKISINGKSKSIGYYKTDYEAHLAYVKKFKEIYGVEYKMN